VDELRRTYHDRIAAVHEESQALVGFAADAVENVTAAMLERDPEAGAVVVSDIADVTPRVLGMETEVLELLAQQAPVARDLRVILAALRITQVAELCIGLARTLGTRAGRSEDVMTPTLRALFYEISAEAVGLLREGAAAWATFDPSQADAVIAGAHDARRLQRLALAELLQVKADSVQAVVDLGMAARAYERITDHAVEIAERVLFVTGNRVMGGGPWPRPGTAT
jgi:phosphate transport system protein